MLKNNHKPVILRNFRGRYQKVNVLQEKKLRFLFADKDNDTLTYFYKFLDDRVLDCAGCSNYKRFKKLNLGVMTFSNFPEEYIGYQLPILWYVSDGIESVDFLFIVEFVSGDEDQELEEDIEVEEVIDSSEAYYNHEKHVE